MFEYDENDTKQEHNNGYFINSVHHTQVKIAFSVRVFFAEEITKYFTKRKIVLQAISLFSFFRPGCLIHNRKYKMENGLLLFKRVCLPIWFGFMNNNFR